MNQKNKTIAIGSLLAALALFAVLGFFLWTVVPILQGREYLKKAAVAYTPDVIINDTFIFEPYTNAQGVIRYILTASLIDKFNDGSMTKPDPLFDYAVSRLEEYAARFPYYYDYFLLLGKSYELQAILKDDPSLIKTAESYYLKSLAVAPGRQDATYAYAVNLISQGRTPEALEIVRDLIARYPALADNHYQLGQALVVSGKDHYDEALPEFEIALDGKANPNPPLTLQIYQKFFYYYYNKGDVARVETVITRLSLLDPAQAPVFQDVLGYIRKNRSLPIINIVEGQ